MTETITSLVGIIHTILPFTGPTLFVLTVLTFFGWLIARASSDPSSRVLWEDLILDTTSGKTSPYKLGYLVGVIVSTWVVTTLTDRNSLSYDIFGMYLTYLLGGASWNSFISKKNRGNQPPSDDSVGGLPPQ